MVVWTLLILIKSRRICFDSILIYRDLALSARSFLVGGVSKSKLQLWILLSTASWLSLTHISPASSHAGYIFGCHIIIKQKRRKAGALRVVKGELFREENRFHYYSACVESFSTI